MEQHRQRFVVATDGSVIQHKLFKLAFGRMPVPWAAADHRRDISYVGGVERCTDLASSLEVTGHAERQSHLMLCFTIINLDRAKGPH